LLLDAAMEVEVERTAAEDGSHITKQIAAGKLHLIQGGKYYGNGSTTQSYSNEL
jgi:hypothetical protein